MHAWNWVSKFKFITNYNNSTKVATEILEKNIYTKFKIVFAFMRFMDGGYP